MTPAQAQLWGGVTAVALVLGAGAWIRLRPPPCHGALTVELRPPLWKPGVYHFDLEFEEGSKGCSFDLGLGDAADLGPSKCPFTRQLRERKLGDVTSIVAFTLGESPSEMRLRIRLGEETIYDTRVEPKYEDSHIDSGQFCGRSAWVAPGCSPESIYCMPFPPACSSRADCAGGKVCCISSTWGKEHGSFAASQCTSARECDGRIDTSIACLDDADCHADRECRASKEGESFRPALRTCEPRPKQAAAPR